MIFKVLQKKTKPNLNVGDLVFAKAEKENKYFNITLTCKSTTNSKVSSSGELKGGKLFEYNRY